MNRNLYIKLKKAKSEVNIDSLEELYRQNPDNLIIKFEYAKRLKKINLELSIKLLLELIGTSNENYALLELGIIEKEYLYYDKAREYLYRSLNSKCWFQAHFWLGIINEYEEKNLQAMIYFNEILNTPYRIIAMKEIKKIRNIQNKSVKSK